jgi:hypothetical protein
MQMAATSMLNLRKLCKPLHNTSAQRPIVDLILLYGRALYRVVTARHHQGLELRQSAARSAIPVLWGVQQHLCSLLSTSSVGTLISKSWWVAGPLLLQLLAMPLTQSISEPHCAVTVHIYTCTLASSMCPTAWELMGWQQHYNSLFGITFWIVLCL